MTPWVVLTVGRATLRILIGQGVPPDLMRRRGGRVVGRGQARRDNETVAIPGRPSAAWLVARRRLGHRWRSWVLLALLTGVASGAVIGAMAGARGAASVYDRLVSGDRSLRGRLCAGLPEQ